jgi:hypothetical protein
MMMHMPSRSSQQDEMMVWHNEPVAAKLAVQIEPKFALLARGQNLNIQLIVKRSKVARLLIPTRHADLLIQWAIGANGIDSGNTSNDDKDSKRRVTNVSLSC